MSNYKNMTKEEVKQDLKSRESLIEARELAGENIIGGYIAAIHQLQKDYMKYAI